MKTDSSGNEQWRRYFGGTNDDLGSFVKQDNQGNYLIAATTNSYSNGTESDMYLIKLDSIGDSLWTRTYGGNFEETWVLKTKKYNDYNEENGMVEEEIKGFDRFMKYNFNVSVGTTIYGTLNFKPESKIQ